MEVNEFNWCEITWRIGHPWGNHHPDHHLSWCGKESVQINNNKLELGVIKQNYDYNGENIPYNVGLVSSKDMFSYGEYEIDAKLPESQNTWSSLWTCSYYGNWLHEFDICESESNSKGTYNTKLFCGNLFKKSLVSTNVHYKDNNDIHHQIGAQWISKLKFINKIDINDYNTYKLVFQKDRIEYYINDNLIRKIADKKILGYINQSPYFYFILNQEVNQKEFTDKNLSSIEPLIIKSIKKIK